MSAEPSIPDQVRAACAWVAERAGTVRIEPSAVEEYAAGIAVADEGELGAGTPPGGDREGRAAFAVCLNAINFGSGWWPTIRKRPGRSGFFTIAAGLEERFRQHGPWTAAELVELSPGEVAAILGQDPEHPLMAQFAASLADVGARLLVDHGGRFTTAVDAGGGSAPALAGIFAGWDAFVDVSSYEGRPVPFFKRAQLAVADLDRAGVAALRETNRLTAFADNLVPHVLRVDGVLRLDPELTTAIEAERLLVHGSAEEVELRACAVHAIELLAASRPDLSPAEIDAALWNRGREARYKAIPRPRSRNTAY